jgi:hypothetical protein
LPYYSAMESEP